MSASMVRIPRRALVVRQGALPNTLLRVRRSRRLHERKLRSDSMHLAPLFGLHPPNKNRALDPIPRLAGLCLGHWGRLPLLLSRSVYDHDRSPASHLRAKSFETDGGDVVRSELAHQNGFDGVSCMVCLSKLCGRRRGAPLMPAGGLSVRSAPNRRYLARTSTASAISVLSLVLECKDTVRPAGIPSARRWFCAQAR